MQSGMWEVYRKQMDEKQMREKQQSQDQRRHGLELSKAAEKFLS